MLGNRLQILRWCQCLDVEDSEGAVVATFRGTADASDNAVRLLYLTRAIQIARSSRSHTI
jgi:hypothetical protein